MPLGRWTICHHFQENRSNLIFWPLYSLNTNLWPFTTPNVRTTCRIWKIITFLEFLSQGRRSDILLNKFQALLIFDPLITLWGHFEAPYFKMLNDARVASACLHVRTCQRVRNSKILQLYATSISQVHSFVCQLDYIIPVEEKKNNNFSKAMYMLLEWTILMYTTRLLWPAIHYPIIQLLHWCLQLPTQK